MKRILLTLALLLPAVATADVQVGAGSTSQCFDVFVSDSSSSVGAGLTALAYNSGSLTAYYHRRGASSATAITLATSTLGTFASGAFKEISSSNMPGWYEFCPPDAALATGAADVAFGLKGAANMAPMNLRVTLVSPNLFGYDGKLAAKSGTSLTLASGAIDVDNQFAYQAEAAFYDSAGLLEGISCITAAVASTEVITTAEDIAALLTVNDNYIIRANSACRNLRPTTAGRALDVTSGGEAGLDFANIAGTLDASEITAGAFTAAKFASDYFTAVNAEVVDTLNVDTYPEPASCLPATSSLQAKISFLAALGRNTLTQTSTTFTLRNDANSGNICSSTTSDSGTTFTRGELN